MDRAGAERKALDLRKPDLTPAPFHALTTQQLLTWWQSLKVPCVILVWDPNSCGTEDPSIPDLEWAEAGILIRKAKPLVPTVAAAKQGILDAARN